MSSKRAHRVEVWWVMVWQLPLEVSVDCLLLLSSGHSLLAGLALVLWVMALA